VCPKRCLGDYRPSYSLSPYNQTALSCKHVSLRSEKGCKTFFDIFLTLLGTVSAQQPQPEVIMTAQHGNLSAALFTTGELIITKGYRKQRLTTAVYSENIISLQTLPMLLQFNNLDKTAHSSSSSWYPL
jgi:hypothetical protein